MYAALLLGQIVLALADQGLFYFCGEDFVYSSESSFCRLLRAHGQVYRRGRAWPPKEPRAVPIGLV